MSSLSGFDVEAVATVGHGFGWITAAEVARRLHVPLHFIVHDDWPRSSAIVEACRPWLERTFGRVYRGAASRLCVSPFMAEEYERRYGAAGSLMYPSRAKDCPVFPAKAARQIGDGEMVIGYGGNSSPLLVESLRALAAALPGTRTRLALFGGFDEDAQTAAPCRVAGDLVPRLCAVRPDDSRAARDRGRPVRADDLWRRTDATT